METIYDDNGVMYVPASEFYKDMVYENLSLSYFMGEVAYSTMQYNLRDLIVKSNYLGKIENKFLQEVIKVTDMPYEEMKRHVDSKNVQSMKEGRYIPKHLTNPTASLRLVK